MFDAMVCAYRKPALAYLVMQLPDMAISHDGHRAHAYNAHAFLQHHKCNLRQFLNSTALVVEMCQMSTNIRQLHTAHKVPDIKYDKQHRTPLCFALTHGPRYSTGQVIW